MPSPKLTIRRIVVDGYLSFDQRFYSGLNIIHAVQTGNDSRSTNGCGKTSLVELIQHGFGKKHDSKAKYFFAPLIDQLKTLWLEFETDSGIYTIRRSLTDIFSSVRVYETPYTSGMESMPSEVVTLDDMSTLLLRLTNIPEVSVKTRTGELTPLSFRLLARAFILHQENSFSEILNKVEPESRKADVIGFLTGITSPDRFPIEEKLGEKIQQQQKLENYISQVGKFLLDSNVSSLVDASVSVEVARNNLELAHNEQRAIQGAIINQEITDKPGHTDTLRRKLLGVKQEIADREQSQFSFQQEEKRLRELVSSLRGDKQKSMHLQASTTQLSHVEFDICPRCLQDITVEMKMRENAGRCLLCNRPMIISSDALPKRILKTDDIDAQIVETEEILAFVQREVENFDSQLAQLKEIEAEISRELELQVSVYVTPAVDQLIAQNDVIAELRAELAKAIQVQEQARAFEKLRTELDKLNTQIAEMYDDLAQVSKAKEKRRESLRQMYMSILRAVNYPKLDRVSIDSNTLMPNINGESYIHGGTAFKGLAVVCYHLALLNLSIGEQTYFPKLLIIDSPNVADLNEVNHTMLLNYLRNLNTDEVSADDDWQIILTTRYLPAGLDAYVRTTLSNPGQMLFKRAKTNG